MPHFNARNRSEGFTLIETLTILIIIGILAAIAAPSFLGVLNRSRVNNALATARGALQEAQRESIRKSKLCTVTIDATNKKFTSPCFVTGDRTLPNGVALATNISGTPSSVTFSFRGNTTSSGKIILYMSDGSGQKKCLAMSNGLGIMRTGDYSGATSTASEITAGTCTTVE